MLNFGISQWATLSSFTDLHSGSFASASSQSVNFGNVAQETTGAFSISVWANPTTTATGAMVDKTTASAGFTLANFGGLLYWAFNSVASGLTQVTCTSPSTSVYTNIIATYDGSGNRSGMKVFYNGVSQTLTGGGSASITSITNTGNLLIAGNDSFGLGYFNGLIDDVSKWPGDLSGTFGGTTGVSQVYGSGHCGNITTTNAYSSLGFASSSRSLWVTFENGSWNDVSPNGYTGTPVNSPTFSTTVP